MKCRWSVDDLSEVWEVPVPKNVPAVLIRVDTFYVSTFRVRFLCESGRVVLEFQCKYIYTYIYTYECYVTKSSPNMLLLHLPIFHQTSVVYHSRRKSSQGLFDLMVSAQPAQAFPSSGIVVS